MQDAIPQIVTFVLALVLAHIGLSRWNLANRVRLWTLVEYLWLATAVLGIAAIANEVKRTDAGIDVHAREEAVKSAYQDARLRAIGADMFSEGNQAAKLAMGDREASWYHYLVESLELGYDNDRWLHFLAQNADLEFGPPKGLESRVPQFPPKGWLRLDPTKQSPEAMEHARWVLASVRRLATERESLRAARSTLTEMTVSKTMRRFREAVSWLLVFALALRITKVRADTLRAASADSVDLTTHIRPAAEIAPVPSVAVVSEHDMPA
jgi:hypothetical protein